MSEHRPCKLFLALVPLVMLFSACAGVNLKTIPAPPPSAKLRVYAVSVSNKPEGRYSSYSTPNDEFENFIYSQVGTYMRETGIYDFVPKKDIQVVLGNQLAGNEAYWWFQKDCALLKEIGKALHADYAVVVARSLNINATYKMTLVNIETGTQFSASENLLVLWDGSNVKRGRELLRSLFRKMFYDAKGDLLATAIRKGQAVQKEVVKKPAAPEPKLALAPPSAKPAEAPPPATPEKKVPPSPKSAPTVPKPPEIPVQKAAPDAAKPMAPEVIAKAAPVPPPVDVTAQDKRRDFEEKIEKELVDQSTATGKTKLVVYDFSATEQLNVVSLILSEALREELFLLGQYLLVNRENLQQVMQELKLQQSGLVDEKEMMTLGRWLAANEAVTGRLAMLGSSYILQAKRTDIRTLGTMGLGSLKCTAGQEEELLKGMPGLARKLAGLKSDL